MEEGPEHPLVPELIDLAENTAIFGVSVEIFLTFPLKYFNI